MGKKSGNISSESAKTAEPASPSTVEYKGWADYLDNGRVGGWAVSNDSRNGPVTVGLLLNGKVIATGTASRHRKDLEEGGIQSGRAGFVLEHGLANARQRIDDLKVVVLGADGAPRFSIPWHAAARSQAAAAKSPAPATTNPAVAKVLEPLRVQLRELIIKALGAKYTSESCLDRIITGNHYQTVNLGGVATDGFRSSREEYLAQIDFSGKTVLDLGCNLGELSRMARARGAALVDGYEYDPYFVEIANLVNAYNGISRVSFYQRDCTDPSIFKESYDIVMAFSVFSYVGKIVEKLAEITRELFIVETHKLEGNLESAYLLPVSKFFPRYRILGQSDWGKGFDPNEKRIVIVFARTEAQLEAALDKHRARFSMPAQDYARNAAARKKGAHRIDVARSCGFEVFLERFPNFRVDALIDKVVAEPLDLKAAARSDDLRISPYLGWKYWAIFLKGYAHYRKSGKVASANPYVQYLRQYYGGPDCEDPGLADEFSSEEVVAERALKRFADLDTCRKHANGDVSELISPIEVLTSEPAPDANLYVWKVGATEPTKFRLIDGWHRLFSARVCGNPQLSCDIKVEPTRVPTMLGAVEQSSVSNGQLTLDGWCLAACRSHVVELRAGGLAIARSSMLNREDIQRRFPGAASSLQSGFSLNTRWPRAGADGASLRIVALRFWMPVGELPVPPIPGA